MKYRFIKNHERQFPIEKMCNVLKVDSSGYFKWKSRGFSGKTLKNNLLKKKIRKLYFKFKQRYGSPRITTELQVLGFQISRITVAKYMKELGLKSKLSKKFKVTTDSKHNYLIAENVLDRDFKAIRISQKWVFDITYIQTKEGFLYLTTIIDLHDRKLIGWSIGNTMSADDISLAALRMVIKNRPIEKA